MTEPLDLPLPSITPNKQVKKTTEEVMASPQLIKISVKEIAKLLTENKTLVMTGAGLSYSQIPSIMPITDKLSKYTTEDCLHDPNIILEQLVKSCFKSFAYSSA